MNQLFVYYNQKKVGILKKKDDATLAFEYDFAWKESGFELSPVLKFSHEGEFNHRQSNSFFENLLPEGKVKERLEKLLGKSLTNGFQFLHEYGMDCAGAFIISPNEKFPEIKIENEFEKLDLEELSKAHLANEHLMSHVIQKHKGRFSLAGAQDKVPLVYLEGDLYVPTKGVATTHILKPPHFSKSVKDSVHNEYFSMELARACGLNVPTVDVIEGKVPFYVVDRFDRDNVDGEIMRLHQVDFCQAQGFLVGEKYEEDGGPKLFQNYQCLRENSSNFIDDSRHFMRWICFNLLLGNNDCHSKNISLLYRQGRFQLSPCYDLLCTSIYKEYSSDFAFSMGANSYWGQWQKSHFQKEMELWGLSKSSDLLLETFNSVISDLDKYLDQKVRDFKERFPKVKVAGRISEEIKKREKSFSKRLK